MANIKKRSKKKKWGLFLIMLLPISFIIWYIITVFFMMSNIGNVCWYDEIKESIHCNGEGTILYLIKNILDRVLSILMIIGTIGLIPGIILFIKEKKNKKSD